jgi:hypothetical protein
VVVVVIIVALIATMVVIMTAVPVVVVAVAGASSTTSTSSPADHHAGHVSDDAGGHGRHPAPSLLSVGTGMKVMTMVSSASVVSTVRPETAGVLNTSNLSLIIISHVPVAESQHDVVRMGKDRAGSAGSSEPKTRDLSAQ